METFIRLLSSRSVLVAAWALIRALISWAAPSVPPPVVAAIDSLAAAIIAAVAVADVRNAVVEARSSDVKPEPGDDV